MAVTKLTCPECGKVLRPAKPLPAGKKVKCPKCGNVFSADEEGSYALEEADPPPKPKAAKAPPVKKAAAGAAKAAKPPKKEDEDEGGTYGYIKEPEEEEEEEERKPKISYAPDTSIKDLRGPAQAMVMKPSNFLMMTTIGGLIGWLILFFLLLGPAVVPIKDDKPPEESPGTVAAVAAGKDKKAGPKMMYYDFFGYDWMNIANIRDGESFDGRAIAWLLLVLFLLVLAMVYCGTATLGAVKMQSLESRGWGIASSILAMVPLTVGGIALLTCFLFAFLFHELLDMDRQGTNLICAGLMGVEWLATIGIGVWNLLICLNEDVVAGFEYEAD